MFYNDFNYEMLEDFLETFELQSSFDPQLAIKAIIDEEGEFYD